MEGKYLTTSEPCHFLPINSKAMNHNNHLIYYFILDNYIIINNAYGKLLKNVLFFCSILIISSALSSRIINMYQFENRHSSMCSNKWWHFYAVIKAKWLTTRHRAWFSFLQFKQSDFRLLEHMWVILFMCT